MIAVIHTYQNKEGKFAMRIELGQGLPLCVVGVAEKQFIEEGSLLIPESHLVGREGALHFTTTVDIGPLQALDLNVSGNIVKKERGRPKNKYLLYMI